VFEGIYYSAMHGGHIAVHASEYVFDDDEGNREMSSDLNYVFNSAAPDYKIWHGTIRNK
jgi:hypothetical protein